MQFYKDIDGDSGVKEYEYGDDYILVQFRTGNPYRYTYTSAGIQNIELMKKLADSGNGLNAFINKNVKNDYEK